MTTVSTSPAAPKACIFLLQLGGPKDLNGIRPFLHNLFADVLPGPKWLRAAMGRLIAWRRTPKVMPMYQAIGGGSPLLRNTQDQADALHQALAERGVPVQMEIVMRYAPPRLEEALDRARKLPADVPWLVVPLYPHYSYATTRSSLWEMSPTLTAEERARLHVLNDYPTEPGYIRAAAAPLLEAVQNMAPAEREGLHVVFSAHGLPLKLVREGDPYPQQVEATVAALVAATEAATGGKLAWTLSYQSRVGPVKWLTPSTSDTLGKLGKGGVKRVLVVPVSFVSEHIETLYELDVELAEEAKHAGIENYDRVPTVGVHPAFIGGLADLVQSTIAKGPQGFEMGGCICDPRRFKQPCICT